MTDLLCFCPWSAFLLCDFEEVWQFDDSSWLWECFLVMLVLSLNKNFVWISFSRESPESAIESPKRKFLKSSLISANFADYGGGRYGFIMFLLNWFNPWFAFPARERESLVFVKDIFDFLRRGLCRFFLLSFLMKLQDIVTYLTQLGGLEMLKLLSVMVCMSWIPLSLLHKSGEITD